MVDSIQRRKLIHHCSHCSPKPSEKSLRQRLFFILPVVFGAYEFVQFQFSWEANSLPWTSHSVGYIEENCWRWAVRNKTEFVIVSDYIQDIPVKLWEHFCGLQTIPPRSTWWWSVFRGAFRVAKPNIQKPVESSWGENGTTLLNWIKVSNRSNSFAFRPQFWLLFGKVGL